MLIECIFENYLTKKKVLVGKLACLFNTISVCINLTWGRLSKLDLWHSSWSVVLTACPEAMAACHRSRADVSLRHAKCRDGRFMPTGSAYSGWEEHCLSAWTSVTSAGTDKSCWEPALSAEQHTRSVRKYQPVPVVIYDSSHKSHK